MSGDASAPLAEVERSGFVESRHVGSLVAIAADGAVRLSFGTPDRPIFPRSCLKPVQAVALLRTGIVEKFHLVDRHVAIMSASHSGEQMHVDVVRELLGFADVPESSLACPHEFPLDLATERRLIARGLEPARVLHNCSGKHAGMLAACAASGWPLAGYTDPAHPLQHHVRDVVAELCGAPVSATGVDGCGAPVFAVPLSGLARAFGRIVTAAPDSAEGQVAAAMRAHPELVGGTGRDVTELMSAVPGLLAKDGAEGCYAVALADGTGIALKIDDGRRRARVPVMVAALRRLGVEAEGLAALAQVPVLGGGEQVGAVRAVTHLSPEC